MAMFTDPYDPHAQLKRGCACGRHADRAACDVAHGDDGASAARAVDAAVMRALFSVDATRRDFLKAVGVNTAMAAVSGSSPLAEAREAFAQGAGKVEKQSIKVGLIPITSATPIVMSQAWATTRATGATSTW